MNSKQLIAKIKEKILNNGYENKKLPTEDMLMEEFGVTRYSVRKAIQNLVDHGLIYQVQGSGMYIKERRDDCLVLSSTEGLVMGFSNKSVTSTLLSLKIVEADDVLANDFKCEKGTPIYRITRLRYLDGVPLCIEYSNYNKNIVTYLNKEIIEGSIYEYLRNDLQLNIGFADKIISSEKLNRKHADLLKLMENDPGLIINDTVYLTNGSIFNSSKVLYNYKITKLFDVANLK